MAPEACQYIIEHSTSSVIVVENESQLKKILQVSTKGSPLFIGSLFAV